MCEASKGITEVRKSFWYMMERVCVCARDQSNSAVMCVCVCIFSFLRLVIVIQLSPAPAPSQRAGIIQSIALSATAPLFLSLPTPPTPVSPISPLILSSLISVSIFVNLSEKNTGSSLHSH